MKFMVSVSIPYELLGGLAWYEATFLVIAESEDQVVALISARCSPLEDEVISLVKGEHREIVDDKAYTLYVLPVVPEDAVVIPVSGNDLWSEVYRHGHRHRFAGQLISQGVR